MCCSIERRAKETSGQAALTNASLFSHTDIVTVIMRNVVDALHLLRSTKLKPYPVFLREPMFPSS